MTTAAGYKTLSLDGGWWGGGKSGKVRRNASGWLTVNDTKFPSSGVGGNGAGLLPLSRYVTARGFLFGMYTSADAVMCSKDVGGSGGNEEKDAALFASWNISLMKLDDCGSPSTAAQGVIERWHGLYAKLMPDRKVMLINSQVGCCVGGSGGCNAKTFGASLPEWCYETCTTMYQPPDGDDMWEVIIERHNSVKGRGHLARPGSWLDPGYLMVDVSTRAIRQLHAMDWSFLTGKVPVACDAWICFEMLRASTGRG